MMQKISTMCVTSQIIRGLKPPFSVNSVHSVQPVQSVQPGTLSTLGTASTLGTLGTAGTLGKLGTAGLFFTGSNSYSRRRTLWRGLYFIHQGTQHLFWWHRRYTQSIINWGRGSKKLLGCAKLWNRASSGSEMVTNAYMTIFPWKNLYCSRELANHRAALDRCWTTLHPV